MIFPIAPCVVGSLREPNFPFDEKLKRARKCVHNKEPKQNKDCDKAGR